MLIVIFVDAFGAYSMMLSFTVQWQTQIMSETFLRHSIRVEFLDNSNGFDYIFLEICNKIYGWLGFNIAKTELWLNFVSKL